ncbi:phospholipid-transporting ATPase, putative [Trypanosoma equiperdum]|uniref:Phospholipid-transporting ATPase, putative n=2 Tax=Trypanozoon TaxID=39700 RepID=Q382N5_TRYB2|nr:phospholipid-transporting ATPase, putative [Trypanosoma brucei brucei TREU927]EAN80246.1 phospholipid-transporting ATPase, putative [Trypanosoma brucei brucei TREU927]SCU65546.1 phospholipid-transporting ATPase, putative [Trypanosoma equiperdum]
MADNSNVGVENTDHARSFVEVNILRGDLNAARRFPSNYVRTSKYTLATCIPKSLLNQFRCVSNIYFLFVTIITMIPVVSPVNPLSTLLPLCIVVGVGMWKDLWEDGKRRKSDKLVNSVGVQVLRGSDFVSVPSRDVRAGDVILCGLGDVVPADAVVLNTSLVDGVTYIETSNLDGETNAKTRRAKPETIKALGTVEDIIEGCLPDAATCAHFLNNGSLVGWKRCDSRGGDNGKGAISQNVLTENGRTSGGTSGQRARASSAFRDVEVTEVEDGTPQSVELPPPTNVTQSFAEQTSKKGTEGGHGRTSTATPTPLETRGSVCNTLELSSKERTITECDDRVPSSTVETSDIRDRVRGGPSGLCSSSNPFAAGTASNIYPRAGAPGSAVALANDGNGVLNDARGDGDFKGVLLRGATPCPDLHSWIGQLRLRCGSVVSLSIDQFLPRGCIIRNTEWVLCAVVYTGKNTKMLLNLKSKGEKSSLTSRRINLINIILLFVHQTALITLCTMSVHWRAERLNGLEGAGSGHTTWYIQWALSRYGASKYFALMYLTNFILLSFLIPISLYVTMELNKVLQLYLIANDRRMASYDEFKGVLRYSRPKTSCLNSQLAYVRYVFTDKTGTLTENVMTYVGGCTATERHDEKERPGALGEAFLRLVEARRLSVPPAVGEPIMTTDALERRQVPQQGRFDFDEEAMEKEPLFRYLRNLSLCHSVVCFDRPEVESAVAAAVEAAAASGHSVLGGSLPPGSQHAFTRRPSAADATLPNNNRIMGCSGTTDAVEMVCHRRVSSITPGSGSVFGASPSTGVGRFLHGHTGSASWRMTCHNDALMHERSLTMSRKVREFRDESKIYEGQSLDEVALVCAARDNLFALQGRTSKHVFVKVVQKVMCYEVVAELQFTSQRKLMSVLLSRCPDMDNASTGTQDNVRISYHRKVQETQTSPSFARAWETPTRSSGQHKTMKVLGDQKGDPTHPVTVEEDRKDRPVDSNARGKKLPFLLLVKGADSSMMSIMNKQNPRNIDLKDLFEVEIDSVAKKGLRTLVLGQRWVSEEEARDWLVKFNEAQCRLNDRDEALHEVYALLEKDVDLIGTTAVSDELQEDVPETVKFLMQADIVVWMLTGDKRETAVTIACTSGIIESGCEDMVHHLDVCSQLSGTTDLQTELKSERIREVLRSQLSAASNKCDSAEEQYGKDTHKMVLVVDGLTLDAIFCDADLTSEFFSIGMRCRSAVCCRMTPLQKAKIVKLFQENTGGVALAIGDGANDVSMIQESSVGIGIMGLEGSQAELASDYAIPKFRFLKRLLMVHGRFSLYRDAHCLVYSLHKNAFLTSAIVVYTISSGFSGMVLIDSWLITFFNLVYCSLQPVLMGVYDKDVEDELAESLPSLYPPLSRENMFFRWGYFTKWFVDGVLLGVLLFVLTYYVLGDDDALHPYRSGSVEDYGTLYFILLLFLVNLRAASAIVCYNLITVAVLALCFIAIPFLTLFYSALPNVFGSNRCVYVAIELVGNIKLWLMLLLCFGIYIMYIMGSNAYIELFKPWLNGERAMRAAWESPYKGEHLAKVKLLRERSRTR